MPLTYFDSKWFEQEIDPNSYVLIPSPKRDQADMNPLRQLLQLEGTKIILGKSIPRQLGKHLRDMMGNEIPGDDEAIKQDIASGKKVLYYREDKRDNKEGKKIVVIS